jgi:hypothetical protein
MAKWPYNAEAGVYKLTVNADKLGSMVTDFASNPAFKEEIGGIKVGCESGADSAALLGNTSSRKESSTSETSGIHTFEVSSAKRAVALTTKKKSNKAPGTTAKAEISLGAARLSPAANFFSFTLPSTVGGKIFIATTILSMAFALALKRKTSSTLAPFAETENEKLLFLDSNESKSKTEREETYGSVI